MVLGMQEAPTPCCQGSSSPLSSKWHNCLATLLPRAVMVAGWGNRAAELYLPATERRCLGWSNVGYPSFPMACSPDVRGERLWNPIFPSLATAVVELMSFCSLFGKCSYFSFSLARRDKTLLQLSTLMPWWHEEVFRSGESGSPFSPTGSCLLGLWSPPAKCEEPSFH